MKVRYLKKSKALFKLILLSTMHGHARSIRNQITSIVNRTSFGYMSRSRCRFHDQFLLLWLQQGSIKFKSINFYKVVSPYFHIDGFQKSYTNVNDLLKLAGHYGFFFSRKGHYRLLERLTILVQGKQLVKAIFLLPGHDLTY